MSKMSKISRYFPSIKYPDIFHKISRYFLSYHDICDIFESILFSNPDLSHLSSYNEKDLDVGGHNDQRWYDDAGYQKSVYEC